jgi:hypothetical protein
MMPLRGKTPAGKKTKPCQVVLALDNKAKKQGKQRRESKKALRQGSQLPG